MPMDVPKLDDITFAQLLDNALKRIPQYAQEWTDHNLHDPGITFIELFAWLTEMQIYYLDQITDKHKLKYLKLLCTKPRPSVPSKTQVTFTITNHKPLFLNSGVKLEAQLNGNKIPFETTESIFIVPDILEKIVVPVDEINSGKVFQSLDLAFYLNKNESFFYPFGKEPKKDDVFYLGFDGKTMDVIKINDIDITLALNLYEEDLLERGVHDEEPDIVPSADVIWEYSNGDDWFELTVISDSTLGFSQSGFLRFKLPLDFSSSLDPNLKDFNENNVFWFRCRILKPGFEIPPRINSIRLNTVNAVQMRKIENDVRKNLTELPNQLFYLENSPVLPRKLVVRVREKGIWREWGLVKNFENSGQEDQDFMLYPEENFGKIRNEIKFGDNKSGKIPPKGSDNIKVTSYVFDQQCEEEFFSSNGTTNQIFKLTKVPPIPKNCLLMMGENGDIWNEVNDFDASKPQNRHYVLDKENGIIKFGNGDRGRIDPNSQVIVNLSYYFDGEHGNVQRGTITKLVDGSKEFSKLKVNNIHDAKGGKKAETIQEATTRFLKDLKERYRAVTLEDFEYIARVTPGLRIARTKAIRKNNKVEVIVVPCIPPWQKQPVKTLSEGFKKSVCRHLDRHRLLTTQIAVVEPKYIDVSIDITVKIEPQESSEILKERVLEKLDDFLHPLTGYDGFGWPFGRSVFRSDICAAVEEVNGVDCIKSLELISNVSIKDEYGNITVPKDALVFSGAHQIQIIETHEPCKGGLF